MSTACLIARGIGSSFALLRVPQGKPMCTAPSPGDSKISHEISQPTFDVKSKATIGASHFVTNANYPQARLKRSAGKRLPCQRIFRQTRMLSCLVKLRCQHLHPLWRSRVVKLHCQRWHPAKVSLYGCTSSMACSDSILFCNTYDILWRIFSLPAP